MKVATTDGNATTSKVSEGTPDGGTLMVRCFNAKSREVLVVLTAHRVK
ncbi:MAG: hypothetical protein K8U57_14930 [Planctomycetes bacterium]|nr:hypothetical protein [Planctomycetota bacterium]